MGELKEIRDQQDNLIQRAKALGNKLYLAGLGAYSKAGDSSEELYDKYVQAGQEAYGDDAEGKSKALLASRGLVVSTRKLIDEAPRKRHERIRARRPGRREHPARTEPETVRRSGQHRRERARLISEILPTLL